MGGTPPERGVAGQGGLLARLDAFIGLVAERRGLALVGNDLAPAERAAVAAVTRLDPGATCSVELLRGLAEAIGVVRTRGARVEVTPLRTAWARLDPAVRAGLVYAAWCHRVRWAPLVGSGAIVDRLIAGRVRVLRLLAALPPLVDVAPDELTATVSEQLGLPPSPQVRRALAAAFLHPLTSLGVAELEPAPPGVPRWLRLGVRAPMVIGSALVAAGEDVVVPARTLN